MVLTLMEQRVDTSNITVGTGKTLDLRGGTLTLDNDRLVEIVSMVEQSMQRLCQP